MFDGYKNRKALMAYNATKNPTDARKGHEVAREYYMGYLQNSPDVTIIQTLDDGVIFDFKGQRLTLTTFFNTDSKSVLSKYIISMNDHFDAPDMEAYCSFAHENAKLSVKNRTFNLHLSHAISHLGTESDFIYDLDYTILWFEELLKDDLPGTIQRLSGQYDDQMVRRMATYLIPLQ